jgi:hypothetical protein
MTAVILVGLLYAVLLILIGWTFGQSAAYREHRRRQDREQQRLAARLNH